MSDLAERGPIAPTGSLAENLAERGPIAPTGSLAAKRGPRWSTVEIANLSAYLKGKKIEYYDNLLYEIAERLESLTLIPQTTIDPVFVDAPLLQEKIEQNFYDPLLMDITGEILQSAIAKDKALFLQDLHLINNWTVNGYAMTASFKEAKKFLVLKVAQNYAKDLASKHELAVGLYGTNSLRRYLPNFSYVYGAFRCSSPIFDVSNEVLSWCSRNDSEQLLYVMYENIDNSVSLKRYIEGGCSGQEFLRAYLQIVFALNLAREKINFTHYDLHADNVLIRKIDRSCLKYNYRGDDLYLETDTIATIIDYGMSYFEGNGVNSAAGGTVKYGSPDAVQFEELFLSARKSNTFHDVYKLLMYSSHIAKNNDNFAVFEICQFLFLFFNPDENLNEILDPKVLDPELFFSYPFVEDDEHRLSDFLNYVLTQNLTTNEATQPVFRCASDEASEAAVRITPRCLSNQEELLQEIKLTRPRNLNELIAAIDDFKDSFDQLTKEEMKFYLDDSYEKMRKAGGQISILLKSLRFPDTFTFEDSLEQDEPRKILEANRLERHLNTYLRIVSWLDTYRLLVTNLRLFVFFFARNNTVLRDEVEKFANVLEEKTKKVHLQQEHLQEIYKTFVNFVGEENALTERDSLLYAKFSKIMGNY